MRLFIGDDNFIQESRVALQCLFNILPIEHSQNPYQQHGEHETGTISVEEGRSNDVDRVENKDDTNL